VNVAVDSSKRIPFEPRLEWAEHRIGGKAASARIDEDAVTRDPGIGRGISRNAVLALDTASRPSRTSR